MNKDKQIKATLPSGFKDRSGNELALKKKLLDIIEKNFIKFGFSPLETTPMELSSIIGNSLAEDDENPMADIFTFDDSGIDISLRYDLSQGCIRYYSQNYLSLPNPYKRYQIDTVYRREKPGNGRYKSFGQCDVDIIGKFDLKQANAELCNIISSTFIDCGLDKSDFVINVSNRKIVQGLMDDLKIKDQKQKQKVLRAIDKLDKEGFGFKGVEELLKRERKDSSGAITKGADLSDEQASKIIEFLKVKDLKELKKNINNPLTQEGIKELEELFEVLKYTEYSDQVKFDSSRIRGLDIYSGWIVETNLKFDVKNAKGKIIDPGSPCSGGEYLVTKFKGDPFLGTGISIGIDRLVFCLSQKKEIEAEEQKPVLICVMDPKYLDKYYEILNTLRKNNISSEIFLESKKKLTKQLEYCNRRGLSVAIICGENEFNENTVTIKNLKGVKGENNQTIPKEKLIDEIRKLI
ncbi:histidine--tRNA ligase [Candidatus Pelagibacter sp.]|nr:histidine--tRNA ligase [Candidatus Pelagibacter sp.]